MKIAIKRQDGGVSIMHIINGTPEGEIAKSQGLTNEWKEISDEDLPDRYFRNAWNYDFSVDMEKAKKIHMEKIRKFRDKKLAELDVETLKGNDVQNKKQKLRDIPQVFDLSSANTPTELKKMWPSELI